MNKLELIKNKLKSDNQLIKGSIRVADEVAVPVLEAIFKELLFEKELIS